MDEVTRGLGANYHEAGFDPLSPWWRPTHRGDRRLHPAVESLPPVGSGRRMIHPFLDDLVYARTPDKTMNLGADVLRRAETVLTRTLDGSAVARYDDFHDDVVIREVWLAETLSTLTAMHRMFHAYWMYQLPPARFIGWQPRDRTWKRYFIEILRVDCGEADGEFLVEQIGRSPGMMRQQLSVTFKTVRAVGSPSSVMIAGGA